MSNSRRDPVLHSTPIAELRPTQMTVGFREVERKRKSWRGKSKDGRVKTLETHMVPIALGPDGERYITDHHHLARALYEEGEKEVFVIVVGDLSKADPKFFWNMMEYHGWTHPFDAKGRRCEYDDLPKEVVDLKDDPYRSLAGELRRIGGFAKDATAFSEFVWADYFRPLVKRKLIVDDFDAALKHAYAAARSPATDFLPGWCGPQDASTTPPADDRRKARD